MELLQCGHAYSGDFEIEEGPNAPRFTHSNFVFLKNNALFYAQSSQLPGSYDINSLDLSPVPVQIFPERSETGNVTVAPNSLSNAYYTKYPNLIQFLDTPDDATANRIRSYMLQEIQVCELLRANPHPNVSEYLGCSVQGGRITTLHFVRYPSNLAERMRKGHIVDKDRVLDDIRRGLDHLHSLGYCHNDLKPTNVMLSSDGTAIINDFDSSQRAGEKLSKGGSLGWNHASYSCPENDWACFRQIERMVRSQRLNR